MLVPLRICFIHSLLLSIFAILHFCFVAPVNLHAEERLTSFNAWLTDFQKEALAEGISEGTIRSALANIKPIPRIIELDRNQPEFKKNLEEYLSRTVSEKRVAKGRKLVKENRDLLEDISEQFGVQVRFLVALWGIESDFGRVTGNFQVIPALVTLAYDGRRSTYFRQECIFALRILNEGLLELDQMKGSWAGAMGQLQFMPSTFYRYAIDYDNDQKRDILGSRGDALASAAQYLTQSGWKHNQTWGREVKLTQNFDHSLLGLNHYKVQSEWQDLGVRFSGNYDSAGSQNLPGSIILPDGPTGRAFLVYSNYHVILKWNRAYNYACAVGILSDRIGEE